jgi:hypothetical protein
MSFERVWYEQMGLSGLGFETSARKNIHLFRSLQIPDSSGGRDGSRRDREPGRLSLLLRSVSWHDFLVSFETERSVKGF